jgi:hypothetical protein
VTLICGDGGGDAIGTVGLGRAELATGVVWGPTTKCFQKEMDSWEHWQRKCGGRGVGVRKRSVQLRHDLFDGKWVDGENGEQSRSIVKSVFRATLRVPRW